MKLTEELIQEHEEIRLVLNIMSKISEDIKNQKLFYSDDIDNIGEFIFNYWDKCHCKKEEKALFPALILEVDSKEKKMIENLYNDHISGKNYLREIKSCVENCKVGNPFSCEKLAEFLTGFVNMLRIHMRNEEIHFFPLACNILSIDKQNLVLEHYDKIDKKILKQKVHEQYHNLLKELEKKYIG